MDNFNNFYNSLKQQEKEYGVEIFIYPDTLIDHKHLDCLWYDGPIGYISYKDYKILIEACGDIRLSGKINGNEVYYRGVNNCSDDFDLLGEEFNDEMLYSLLDSDDKNNSLTALLNNWFEFNVIDPNGKLIDLFWSDNVLDNNVLECFSDVSTYFKFVDDIILENEKQASMKTTVASCNLDEIIQSAENKAKNQSVTTQCINDKERDHNL